MTRRFVISSCVAAVALLSSAPALAHSPVVIDRGGEVSAPVYEQLVQRQISASEAKRIALRRVPGGEVVDISRNGDVYRVRVVARSGRVVDVRVDANTGRIVG